MKLNRLIIIFLLVINLFANQEKIILNFKNLTINNFIKMVAKITKKNILAPENINGKVNFISVKPINKEEIYDLLINVLKTKGYTIIETPQKYLLVIKSKDALKEAPPIYGNSKINQIQTDIIGIRYVDASKIFSSINFMISRNGKATLVKDTNTIIITDFPKNLKKIKKIISIMDKKRKKDIKFVSLKNANVLSLYPKIEKISKSLFPIDTKTKQLEIIPNESTNTFIILGDFNEIKILEDYIKRLDKKDDIVKPSIHIIKLKNSDCNDLQKVLNDLISKKMYDKKEYKPSITVDVPTNTLIILSRQKEF